jgi:thiol-disulfide isomerase/thioredoxin
MKLIYCLLVLLCPYINKAQPSSVKALTVGDAIPGMVYNNVLNYSGTSIDLNSFKGKLVILDFMLTTCSSCLQKLPLFDSLQKSYAGKIQFIIVSSQRKEIVKTFLQNQWLGKQIHFPVITNDVKLKELFPHEWVSHLVWVAPDGTVKAITDGDYVTGKNIRQVLENAPINWPIKRDVPDFDYTVPFTATNAQVQSIQPPAVLSSCFMPYINDVGQYHIFRQKDSINHTVRTAFYNQPIIEMYLRLRGKFWFPRSQIILNVKDSSRYILDETKYFRRQWMEQNTFCYESILPTSTTGTVQQQRIWDELDFYFGIHTVLEERAIPCQVLRQKKPPVKPSSIANELVSISTIVYEMNQACSGIPVFIEDKELEKIRLPVSKAQLQDRAVLTEILQQNGYELVQEIRRVEVLVITEPNYLTNQTN